MSHSDPMANSYSGTFGSVITPVMQQPVGPQMIEQWPIHNIFKQKSQPMPQQASQLPQQFSIPPTLRQTASLGPSPVKSQIRPTLPDEIAFLIQSRRLMSELYVEKIHLVRGVLGAL